MTKKKVKETKSGIVPSDPGPERIDWGVVADDLRADPGQWYLIFEKGLHSTARSVAQGSAYTVHPRLGFRTRTKNNTGGRAAGDGPRHCDLYMMFDPTRVDPLAVTLYQAKGK